VSVGGPYSGQDPVGELRFLAELQGMTIGAFRECSGLQAEYEVMEYMPGGADSPIKLRGAIKYPNIVLKRGVTSETALLDWFFRAQKPDDRPNLSISLIGPDASTINMWVFHNAFPLKWQGPSLNAGSSNIAIETLEVTHAGLDHTQSGAPDG
jgi:phage tail-like protein